MTLIASVLVAFFTGFFLAADATQAQPHYAEIPIPIFKVHAMDNTEHERWHAYAVAALTLPKWREGSWSSPKTSADWAIAVADEMLLAYRFRSGNAPRPSHILSPSGGVSPSQDDINLTRRLVQVGETQDIDIIDHIIIGSDDFLSMKERWLT